MSESYALSARNWNESILNIECADTSILVTSIEPLGQFPSRAASRLGLSLCIPDDDIRNS